jgi:MFS family permease
VIQSCGLAIAVKVTPKHRLGLVNSTFYIFLDLGIGVGPLILGLFIPFTGYRGMYAVMVGVVLFSTFLYHMLYGRNCSKKEDECSGNKFSATE